MSEQLDEIIRTYSRALKEGFPIYLNTPESISFYLNAILDLKNKYEAARHVLKPYIQDKYPQSVINQGNIATYTYATGHKLESLVDIEIAKAFEEMQN